MRKLTQFALPVLAGLLLFTTPAVARQHSRDRNRNDDGPKQTERVDQTVQIRAGGELHLKNFSGRVTITGSNRSDIALHARRRAPPDRLTDGQSRISRTTPG